MTDPFPQATPADLAEQATSVDDENDAEDLSDAPLESNPADFQEQHQPVPIDDDEH